MIYSYMNNKFLVRVEIMPHFRCHIRLSWPFHKDLNLVCSCLCFQIVERLALEGCALPVFLWRSWCRSVNNCQFVLQ